MTPDRRTNLTRGTLQALPRQPLRVGVVADAAEVPWYAADMLCAALDQPEIELVGVYSVAPDPAAAWAHHLFDGLEVVEKLLGRIRGKRTDDFAMIDIAVALSARRLRQLAVVRRGNALEPDAAACDYLRTQGLDVLLCCTCTPLAFPPGIVRYGVLGLEVGHGVPAVAAWAGAAELAQDCPVTLTRLVDYAVPGSGEIYAASAGTIATSIRRNRRAAFARGGAVLRRHLHALDLAGAASPAPRLQPLPADYPRDVAPSFGLFARSCRRMAGGVLRNRLDARSGYTPWHLAYAFTDRELPDIAFESLRYLAPAPGTFWADPFPLMHEGRHYILFEEFPYASQRGRLRAVEVRADGPAGAPLTVLERDYHLSYPQAFHWDGNLYMVPETRQARRVELLRCVEFPGRWELAAVLLDDVRAVDATLWQQDGSWWMFVNVALEGVETADELHLYFADSLFGAWTRHPASPVCADVRCARSAGPLFMADGKTFRPGQDGARGYGHALWINRIERLDRTGYREQSVRRIAPDWHPGVSRIHTLGRCGRLTVLDCVVDDGGGLEIQRTY